VKWLYGIFAIGLVLMAVAKTPSHGYRLTVEIETPNGLRRGEAVRHVFTPCPDFISTTLFPIGAGPQWSVEGEAVFIDLGSGRNVVALLAHGPKGDDNDRSISLALYALIAAGQIDAKGTGPLPVPMCKMGRHRGSTTLPPELIPTLVTFTDLNNPASAQVVYATGTEERWVHGRGLVHVGKVVEDRFTALYGPGFALKEVRLEMVSAGIWPFNLLPIPFPQALFGTPITTGIEKRFSWWDTPEVTRNPGWMQLPDISRRALGSMKRGN
jgi:hypothetical protein